MLLLFNKFIYPKTHKGIEREVDLFFGKKMKTLLPSGTDILLNGIKSHDSEIRLSKFLCAHLKQEDEFIDVGAHYGYYSLLAATLVGRENVYSIEASQSSFQILKDNLHDHPAEHVMHTAAGNKDGKIVFYEYPGPYAEYNTTREDAYREESWLKNIPQTITTVPVIPLDHLFDKNKIEKAFIKIDVEGGELSVIEGLSKSLMKQELTIIMEYLSAKNNNGTHREAGQALKAAGYVSYVINEDGSLQKCDDIEERLKEMRLDSDNVVFRKNAIVREPKAL